MRKFVALFMIALATAACEGPTGPAGPSGTAGPPGPAGPGTRVVLSATVVSDRSARATLPAGAGTTASLPAMSCYLNQPGASAYLLIGTDLAGPTCGIVASGSALQAVMIEAPPGWTAWFVIVY